MFALLAFVGFQSGVYYGLEKTIRQIDDRRLRGRKTNGTSMMAPDGTNSTTATYNPPSDAKPAARDSPVMTANTTPQVTYDPGVKAAVSESYPMAMNDGFVLRSGGGNAVRGFLGGRRRRKRAANNFVAVGKWRK